MIWPGLYLMLVPLNAWPTIMLGLAVEFFFVRKITTLNLRMCITATICMNAASSVLGVIIYLFAGYSYNLLLDFLFCLGYYNPGRWLGLLLLIVLINSVLEWGVLRAFKQTISRIGFLWLCLANSLSVTLALYAVYFLARLGVIVVY